MSNVSQNLGLFHFSNLSVINFVSVAHVCTYIDVVTGEYLLAVRPPTSRKAWERKSSEQMKRYSRPSSVTNLITLTTTRCTFSPAVMSAGR